MKNKETFNKLSSKGYYVNDCPYSKYDSLEKNDDIEYLSEILLSFKDKNNNPVKFTLNRVEANPDFNEIKKKIHLRNISTKIQDKLI